jgi:hypothetical protein
MVLVAPANVVSEQGTEGLEVASGEGVSNLVDQ